MVSWGLYAYYGGILDRMEKRFGAPKHKIVNNPEAVFKQEIEEERKAIYYLNEDKSIMPPPKKGDLKTANKQPEKSLEVLKLKELAQFQQNIGLGSHTSDLDKAIKEKVKI